MVISKPLLPESGLSVQKSDYDGRNKNNNGQSNRQIAFHIGVNCTDDDRILKSLLKNSTNFADAGIKVPGPGKYRRLLRETIQNLNGAPPAENTRNVLLDAILEEENVNRLVLSNANFICIPNRIFDGGVLYQQAEAKIRALHQLFRTMKSNCSLACAIRPRSCP